MGSPDVVYLDEPSTGLDPASRRNLWDVVKSSKTNKWACSVSCCGLSCSACCGLGCSACWGLGCSACRGLGCSACCGPGCSACWGLGCSACQGLQCLPPWCRVAATARQSAAATPRAAGTRRLLLTQPLHHPPTHHHRPRSIILTTHSMEEAEMLCDRLGIFVDGQVRRGRGCPYPARTARLQGASCLPPPAAVTRSSPPARAGVLRAALTRPPLRCCSPQLVCIGNPKEITSRYGGYYVFTITVPQVRCAAAGALPTRLRCCAGDAAAAGAAALTQLAQLL
jgi:hypothetical protein